MIGEVFPDLPAMKGGIRAGDVVLEFNEWRFSTDRPFEEVTGSLMRTMSESKEGRKRLRLPREGKAGPANDEILDFELPPGAIGIRLVDMSVTEEDLARIRKRHAEATARPPG